MIEVRATFFGEHGDPARCMRGALRLVVVCILASRVTAGELTSAKSVRAAFLSRGAGARPMSMGEAYTAVADDASAASWNPAGLGQLDSLSAVAMYDHLGDALGMRYVAAAMPVPIGVAGLSLTAMSYGSYDVFNEAGIRTGSKELTDVAGAATWAFERPLWPGSIGWAGVTAEVVHETVGDTLPAGGVGALVLLSEQVTVGAAVQHLGPGKDGGSLPAVARAGGSYLAREWLRVTGDVSNELVQHRTWVAAGTEAMFGTRLALRAGYRHALDNQRISGLTGVTAGIGFRMSGVGVDYAYQPFGELAVSHRFALVYGAASGPGEAR